MNKLTTMEKLLREAHSILLDLFMGSEFYSTAIELDWNKEERLDVESFKLRISEWLDKYSHLSLPLSDKQIDRASKAERLLDFMQKSDRAIPEPNTTDK